MRRMGLLVGVIVVAFLVRGHAQSKNLDIQGHIALADPDHNTSRDQIANFEETADCKGNWIRASIAPDGKFTITNGRNGFSKSYVARSPQSGS
jgi:hypothetical protein